MALREKILIIGNGFDLYHELPTKYSQFIKVLMNIESLNIEDKNVSFDDLFKDVERNSEMKIRFDTEKMIFDRARLFEIKDNLKDNSWYNSFKEKLSFENWIDVENEIKETLKLFQYVINKINTILSEVKLVEQITINDNGYNSRTKIVLNQNEINYCKAFHLTINENRLLFVDFKKFDTIDTFLIKFKTSEFYENLFIELQIFTNIFNIYLESIVGLFYQKIDSKYSSNLEILKENINYFYTFNYTSTLEKFYGIDIGKVNFLHGKHSLENHNIVLGIEEIDSELQDVKIYMFTKYYQKLFNDTDYQFLSEMKPKNLFDYYEKDFILFGHSLAENDQNYLIELFEIVKLRDKSTITIFHNTINDKAQKLKNLLKIIGRKDIELLMKKKCLNFVQIKERPFETVFKSLPESYNTDMSPTVH